MGNAEAQVYIYTVISACWASPVQLLLVVQSNNRTSAMRACNMYVCMYLMIGKGQIVQKDHIGVEIDLRTKLMVNIIT